MDACAHKGIIPRAPGPRGVMVSDIKRVFSQLWQGSQQVVVLLETLKKKDVSPEEVLELFFDGGSEDQVLWCFVILVWLNHEDTSVLLRDLPDHAFDNVDDAYNSLNYETPKPYFSTATSKNHSFLCFKNKSLVFSFKQFLYLST